MTVQVLRPQSSMSAAQQDYAYENIHWEKNTELGYRCGCRFL